MNKEFLNYAALSPDARLNLIDTLLASPGIDTALNLQIITGIPTAQETGDVVAAVEKVKSSKKVFTEIKDITDKVFKSAFKDRGEPTSNKASLPEIVASIARKGDPKECLYTLHDTELLCFKHQSRFIDNTKYEKGALIGALSHYALNVAIQFHRATENQEIKSMAKAYIFYFAAIEALAIGVKTNAQIQALNPDSKNLFIEEGPTVVVTFDSGDDIKKAVTQELFEGNSATPLPEVGDGKGFIISPNQPDLSE
jgi:hypothetical protein